MKSTVIALLATTSQAAVAPAGTSALAGGNLDEAGYMWLTDVLPDAGYTECDVDADCNVSPATGNSCAAFMIGDAQADQGYCIGTPDCGDDKLAAIWNDGTADETSAETYSMECNDATTDATGEAMDIMDFMYWDAWTSGLSACTADADCTVTGTTCGDAT